MPPRPWPICTSQRHTSAAGAWTVTPNVVVDAQPLSRSSPAWRAASSSCVAPQSRSRHRRTAPPVPAPGAVTAPLPGGIGPARPLGTVRSPSAVVGVVDGVTNELALGPALGAVLPAGGDRARNGEAIEGRLLVHRRAERV